MSNLSKIHLNPWRELTILMIIIMEVSWITPWFKVFTSQVYAASPSKVWAILATNILFSHCLIRVLEFLKLKQSIRRIISVLFLLFICIVGLKTLIYPHQSIPVSQLLSQPFRNFADIRFLIPIEFIVILSMLLSFWRGIALAQEYIGPTSTLSHFWIGIFMYIVYVFFITIVTGETPGDFFFLFLFSGLIGVSTARMSVINRLRGGREAKFYSSWFFGIFLTSCASAALASISGAIIGIHFNSIRYLVLIAFGSIIVILWLIFSPIFILVFNLLSRLLGGISGLADIGKIFQQLNQLFNQLGQKIASLMNDAPINSVFSSLTPIIKTIVLIGILVMVILVIILWMGIKPWTNEKTKFPEEEINSSSLNSDSFRSILANFRNNLKGSLYSIKLIDFKRQRMRDAKRIRQIYAEVLDLCEILGKPRPSEMTPLEFEPHIGQLFTEFHDEISLITHAYLGVRYGTLPEIKSEVIEVENAWSKLRLAGSELKRQKK